MHSLSRITIFCAQYPALSPAAVRVLKTSHAPSAPRMAHGLHHGATPVRRHVRHDVRRGVARKSLPKCLLWAAGARPVRIPARAIALLLRKDATGFRALSLKPASLLRKAQASLPVPRSHRAPASQGQKQNPRGGHLRNGLRALGQNRFPSCPPALPRPTGGLFARVPSLMNKAASRSRCALDEAPHRSRLGTLPPLSLVGTRDCFRRDRLSQRWGASFPLLRLGASHHGSPAWGPAQTFPLSSESFLPLSPVAEQPARTLRAGERANVLALRKRKGCGRSPIESKSSSKAEPIAVQAFSILNQTHHQTTIRS